MMKKFDDIIQDKVQSHEARVPADAWANIKHRKKKRRFVFFWWTICGLLLFGVATTVYISESDRQTKEGHKPVSAVKAIEAKASDNPFPEAHASGIINGVDNARKVKEANQDPGAAPATNNQENSKAVFEPSKGPAKPIAKPTFNHNKNTGPERNRSITNNADQAIFINKKSWKNDVKKDGEAASSVAKRISGKTKGKTSFDITNGDTANDEIVKNEIEPVYLATEQPVKERDLPVTVELPVRTTDSLKNADVKKDGKIPVPIRMKKNVEKSKKHNRGSWFVDFAVIPMLPVQMTGKPVTVSRTIYSPNNITEFRSGNIHATLDPALAFSLNLKKNISNRIRLGAGLQYVHLKEKLTISGKETNTVTSVIDVMVDGISGPEMQQDTVTYISEGVRQINAVNSYRLISIPVFIQYDLLLRNKWSVGLVGGGFLNVSSSYQNEINKKPGAPLLSSNNITKTNTGIDLYGGFRFGRMVGRKLELFALPSIRWNLGGYKIKDSFFDQKIHQLGLGIGLSVNLN
jgi:hypothetical protein